MAKQTRMGFSFTRDEVCALWRALEVAIACGYPYSEAFNEFGLVEHIPPRDSKRPGYMGGYGALDEAHRSQIRGVRR